MLWNCGRDAKPDIFQSSGCDLGGDLVDSPDFLNDCVSFHGFRILQIQAFPGGGGAATASLESWSRPGSFLMRRTLTLSVIAVVSVGAILAATCRSDLRREAKIALVSIASAPGGDVTANFQVRHSNGLEVNLNYYVD